MVYEDVFSRYLEEDGKVKGFIRINFKEGYPHLQHIYLHQPYRNYYNARKLIEMFIETMQLINQSRAIIHAGDMKEIRLIEYYFKRKPYAVKNGFAWFLVDINNRR